VTELALPFFLAHPAGDGPWPGVVVIHEGGGITPQLLRFCQRLATEGYATAAPDLFFRAGGTHADDYTNLIASLRRDETLDDVHAAAAVLRALGAPRVGVTGFCMGGLLTYRSAVAGGFDAAVSFYGAGIARELGELSCPTLLLFGGSDPYIPAEEIDTVVAHHPSTVVYPEADHGFMRDGSEHYHEASATDAWGRLLAFFADRLS
jgi:carboxymethylenebutenolidase